MGSRFNLKAFDNRVLEDGAVPLTFLRDKIRTWATSSTTLNAELAEFAQHLFSARSALSALNVGEQVSRCSTP